MQGPRLENLVGRCAEVAGKGKHIDSYVLVYQMKNGAIRYHRDGSASSQLGLVEVMKRGIVNGLFHEEEE